MGFLLHQFGVIGSVVVFANAACGHAFESFPDPCSLAKIFAVSFVAGPQQTREPVAGVDEEHDRLRAEGLRRRKRDTAPGRRGGW